MPRLSITLTATQAEALDRIAAVTGATKQSMIGLAITAWIRQNDVQETIEDEIAALERSIVVKPREIRQIPYVSKKVAEDGSELVCALCGKPAVWFSTDPDGVERCWCDEHGYHDLLEKQNN